MCEEQPAEYMINPQSAFLRNNIKALYTLTALLCKYYQLVLNGINCKGS